MIMIGMMKMEKTEMNDQVDLNLDETPNNITSMLVDCTCVLLVLQERLYYPVIYKRLCI